MTRSPSGAEFPPSAFQAGSVGDADYSPLLRVGNLSFNASIIAFDQSAGAIHAPSRRVDYSRVHDEVLAIDTPQMTVTLQMVKGLRIGRPIWYISMDASIPLAAAVEGATFAPLMAELTTGGDDRFSSPVERLFVAVKGPSQGGCGNPMRQGLNAALAEDHRPNNTFGGIPTIAPDYSPMWNANLYEWTPDAVARSYRGNCGRNSKFSPMSPTGS